MTINFGIDLGTTNSLIAKFNNGTVEIFKNPVGHKESLPSVVGYRSDKIIIGDKAKEILLKSPMNVFTAFKRKMGTSDKYTIPTKNNETVSPIELSSLVLKELKNFIHTGEQPESVVITIPASFDTVQSNATKKAGLEAGFKEVVLLQEPIAASLAFFNKQNDEEETQGKWFVYDLGGGTFDVALIGIENNEMKVIDHEGDNYLGGIDFDLSLIKEAILPALEKASGISNLASLTMERSGEYEKLFYLLLHKAEEAKKELSNKQEIEIEVNIPGLDEEVYINITRAELNNAIKVRVNNTLEMLDQILERNNLTKEMISEVIMIGGSTYIPYVRETVSEKSGIKINCSSDPTTAVAVGAAYYAGNKYSSLEKNSTNLSTIETSLNLDVKMVYNKSTRDTEEYFAALVTGGSDGLQYRITRTDGGFDTGIKNLDKKISEFLTVRSNVLNEFTLKIFDIQGILVWQSSENIQIASGQFTLYGQPLPEDISIEIDDLHNNSTKCEVLFARNSILPISKTIYKQISRTIKTRSEDSVIINLLEGNNENHPSVNKIIGILEINGKDIPSDLIKGSEVEIKVEVSESRDVTITTNLLLFDKEFLNIFSPTERYISVNKLKTELQEMLIQFEKNEKLAIDNENYELAAEYINQITSIKEMQDEADKLKENSPTDEKYQLDDKKRKFASNFFKRDSGGYIHELKEEFINLQMNINYQIEYHEDVPANLVEQWKTLEESSHEILKKGVYLKLKDLIRKGNKIFNEIIYQSPSILANYYSHYKSLEANEFKNYSEVKKLIIQGDNAVERKSWLELRQIFNSILNQVIKLEDINKAIKGTGLN